MKKKAPKRRVIYLDVIVVDCEDFCVTEKKTGEQKILQKSFCKLVTSTQEMTTSVAKNCNPPMWNSDSTFILRDESEELVIELYQKNKKKEVFIGQTSIKLSEYPLQVMHDLYSDIMPPPSCESKKLFVSGKIHFKIFKSFHVKKMPLSHCGKPSAELPLRIDIGDIILCSNQNILTKTVHLTTKSQWDHVAMVVRNRDTNKLRLFEVTLDGVETYLLSTALKYYREHCGRVAIRRVLLEKDAHFMEELLCFVEEVLGRPYKQDWMQLIKATYNANEEDDLTSLFCSQLIAAAYQRLDIISKDIPSNNFVPSDFANDLRGQLKGARLGETRKIPALYKNQIIKKEEIAETVAVQFNLKGIDCISNIKIVETATKRDAKLQAFTVYIMNVFTTKGVKWILFKRFNEFSELDKELRKYFDGLPRIPTKLAVNTSLHTIQHRRVELQKYMKCLIKSPVVRCSLFTEFVTAGRKGVVEHEQPGGITHSKPKKSVTPDIGKKSNRATATRKANAKSLMVENRSMSLDSAGWVKVSPRLLNSPRSSTFTSQSRSSRMGSKDSPQNDTSSSLSSPLLTSSSSSPPSSSSSIISGDDHCGNNNNSGNCNNNGGDGDDASLLVDRVDVKEEAGLEYNDETITGRSNSRAMSFLPRRTVKEGDSSLTRDRHDELRKSFLFYSRKFGVTLDEEEMNDEEEEEDDIDDDDDEIYFVDEGFPQEEIED